MQKPFIGLPARQWLENYQRKNVATEQEALYHLLDEMRRDVQALKNAQFRDE